MVSWWVPYLPKGCRPDFNNGLGGDSNSGPVLASGVYLSPTRIMAPPQATPILFKSPIYDFLVVITSGQGRTPDFNLGNDCNSDVSKQIRLCTGPDAPARNSQVTCTKHSCGVISLTSLGQPTIRLRRYGWETSTEGSLRRKKEKKNKVEEIQPANSARPSQAKITSCQTHIRHFG